MKKILITLCLGFCSFNLGLGKESLVESPNAQQYTLYVQSQLNRFSFPLKMSVQELVQLLRNDLGMRVNFENECLSSKDAYTAKDIVEIYISQDFEALSPQEKHLYNYAKKMLDSNEGHIVIDYRKRYLNLEPADLLDFSKLIKKIEATNLYIVELSQGAISIYPHNISYANVESFGGDFESSDEAYKQLWDLLKVRKLNFIAINSEPPKKDNFKLDVKDENFRLFLTKFTQELGADVVWNISGYKTGRFISFNKIKTQ